MMTRIRTLAAVAAAAASCFIGPVLAQGPLFLQQGRAGEVAWVAGGTSAAEIDALAAREQDHSLKLVFTLLEGNWLAGVDVTVRDAKGAVVLEQRDTGPVLLARLPRGRYTVVAVSEGRSQTRPVTIGDRMRTEYLRWPSLPERDFPLPPERPEPGESAKARPAAKSAR
jgi:hypothetical protein